MDHPIPIVSIDADAGGVPAMVKATTRIIRGWGGDVIVYRTRSGEPVSRFTRLLNMFRQWRGQPTVENGHDAVHLPTPPLPLGLYFVVPQFLVGRMLGQYDSALVVTGSAHTALPLALRGMPYTLWVATIYEDEVRGKAEAGDSWAQGVLAGRAWRMLERQEKFVFRRASRILALSEYTAREIRKRVPEVDDIMTVMPFPIDTARFHPNPAMRANPPYGRYLLFAARFNDPRKNVGLLLRAYARVRHQHPDLKLVLVGDEPDDHVREMVQELNIEDGVIFPGLLPNGSDDLLHLYQGAELFALPSFQEGLGIVMLEALACGTPVVSTACGGPEGVITDGVTGQIVHDFHDDEKFADAILGLLADPGALQAMRAQCAEFAAENFSYPVVSEQLHEAYDAMQNEPRRASRLRSWLAMGWGLVVLGTYIQHQLVLHWDSIQLKIIDPLVSILS